MYTIENYSEKAIAVFGNFESIKDTLSACGGKFNYNLKGRAGWIFSKAKEPELRKALVNMSPQASVEAHIDDDVPVQPLKRLLKAQTPIAAQDDDVPVQPLKRLLSEKIIPEKRKVPPHMQLQNSNILDNLIRIEEKLDLIIKKLE